MYTMERMRERVCIPLVVLAVSVELERAIKIMHALRGLDSSNAHTHTVADTIYTVLQEKIDFMISRDGRTKKKTG